MAKIQVEHGTLELHSPYRVQNEAEVQFKVTATTHSGETATFMTKTAAMHYLSMDADLVQGRGWREGVANSVNLD